MPRGPGSPIRPRKQPITDEHVLASAAGGHTAGHYAELVQHGLSSHEIALEFRRSLHRCAKRLGYAMTAQIEAEGDQWAVRFHAIDKETARAYIRAKYPNGDAPYNPYRRTLKDET